MWGAGGAHSRFGEASPFPPRPPAHREGASAAGGGWADAVHSRNVHSGAVKSQMPLGVMLPLQVGDVGRGDRHSTAFRRQIGVKRP